MIKSAYESTLKEQKNYSGFKRYSERINRERWEVRIWPSEEFEIENEENPESYKERYWHYEIWKENGTAYVGSEYYLVHDNDVLIQEGLELDLSAVFMDYLAIVNSVALCFVQYQSKKGNSFKG